MTAKEAIDVILSDKEAYNTTTNYAINYCKASKRMDEGSEEFRVQCFYILGNIIYWRNKKAAEVRKALRLITNAKNKNCKSND